MNGRMTSGNIFKSIILFAIPMVLGGMLQHLYYMVDLIIAGRFLGDSAIAAAGANVATVSMILNGVNGISTGATICVAKVVGEGREHGETLSEITGGFAAFMGALILIISVSGVLGMRQLLQLLNVPADIMDEAVLYSRIVFCGLPFQAFYSLFAAYLRGIGNSSEAMFAIALAAVTNLSLDIGLICYAGMGVGGLAAASVAAQAGACVFLFVRIRVKYLSLRFSLRQLRLQGNVPHAILHLGVPVGIQRMILPFGSALSKYAIYSFGTAAVAGITTAYQIDEISMLMVSNMGSAVTAFAAQNRSAGLHGRAKKGFWYGTGFSVGFSVMISILFYLFSETFIGWFGVSAQTTWFAKKLLLTCCLFYPVYALECTCLGYLQAYEIVGVTVLGNLAALTVRVTFIYATYQRIGFVAVPLSEALGWTAAAALYVLRCAGKDISIFRREKQRDRK